jgi:type-F conjugative transfer system secretin TraK
MKINKYVILLLLLPGCAFAVQNITVTQSQPVRAVVSQNDMNLISLKNDRIESLALPNSVIVEQNTKNGSAFLSFKSNAVVKGFLTTELGAKYQLEFVPSNIASETIVLIAPGLKAVDSVDAREYTQTLAQLMRAMYNDAELDGFARTATSKKLKINNMKLSLEAIYEGDAIEGQVLDFKNTTDIAMTLKEVDFYTAGVRAVSIVDKALSPQSSTQVFIMRDKL